MLAVKKSYFRKCMIKQVQLYRNYNCLIILSYKLVVLND